MRILTIGDSWTYGSDSSDPHTKSWPAQMAENYNVDVVNLARPGSSNQRAARICIEEICRDSKYDYIIFPLAPASRTEILKTGKWHQIWPNARTQEPLDRIYTEFWHPWNDLQNTIMLCFYFIHSIKSFNIPLYITGLSLYPSQYKNELGWINNYSGDYEFNSLKMPLDDLNIGSNDLHRKLLALRAIHQQNLLTHPEYLTDVINTYLRNPETEQKYKFQYKEFKSHLNDNGYLALGDYFAQKIGIIS
jgi:hypothetical protein